MAVTSGQDLHATGRTSDQLQRALGSFFQVQLLHYVLQQDHIQRMASKTGVNSTSVRELSSGAGFIQN
jgi:hypothetical protein